jgi:hypothetical protein
VLVLEFDPERYNYIIAGEKAYFLLRLPDGELIVVDDRCLHRGGPLHLGQWDAKRNCLVCPWHETRYSEKILRKRAIPMLRRGARLTAILDVAPEANVILCKKVILAQPS